MFPRSSDPSNASVQATDAADYAPVHTISFGDILARNNLKRVDLLKLDCEGAEYPIILESPTEAWSAIQEMKLEYHLGNHEQLVERLRQLGFTLQSHRPTTSSVGHLWLSR